MRYIIVIFCFQMFSPCYGQTFNEWFKQKKTQTKYLIEQTAALRVYLETVKKGYDIANKGLTLIGDIKDGSFQMDRTYFASLKNVNPVIRDATKVAHILAYQGRITAELQRLKTWVNQDDHFTAEERHELLIIQRKILQQGSDALQELALVTTPDQTEMKDDQRIQRIDRIYSEMQQRYVFVQSVCNTAKALSRARLKDQHSIDVLRAVI